MVRVILDQLLRRRIKVVSSISRLDLLHDLSCLKSHGVTSIFINGKRAFHGRSENFGTQTKTKAYLASTIASIPQCFD